MTPSEQNDDELLRATRAYTLIVEKDGATRDELFAASVADDDLLARMVDWRWVVKRGMTYRMAPPALAGPSLLPRFSFTTDGALPPPPEVVSPERKGSAPIPPSAGNPYFDPANIDPDYEEFWSKTDVLRYVHHVSGAAWYVNPYALLGVALANAATHIPTTTLTPVGEAVNLTVGVLVEYHGAGASTTMRTGDEVLPPTDHSSMSLPAMTAADAVRDAWGSAATVLADNITVADMVNGDLRSRDGERMLALMDGRAVDGLPANGYRFTLRESVYLEENARWLFHPDQVALGLPQRYLLVPLWGPPGGGPDNGVRIVVPDAAEWDIGAASVPEGAQDDADAVRLGVGSELDRAWIRLRFRTTMCLAALHGRTQPTTLDWELSLTLLRLTQRLAWKTYDLAARMDGRLKRVGDTR